MATADHHHAATAGVAFTSVAFDRPYTDRSNCRKAMVRYAGAQGLTAADFEVTQIADRDYRFIRKMSKPNPDFDDGIPAALKISPEDRKAAWDKNPPRARPAITTPKKDDDMKKATTTKRTSAASERAGKVLAGAISKAAKKASAKKRAAPKSDKAPKAPTTEKKAKGVRPGSKLEIVAGLLLRKEGCTAADILAATEWPAVSVPQQARAAGLTLRQEKDGKVTRYWGA